MPDRIVFDGFFDPDTIPIDSVLRQAFGEDAAEFRGACTTLGTMALAGRREAGVFLLGLLSFYRDDLERLAPVVRALRAFPIPETVAALTAELRRIPSSNHTRTYLNGVFEAVTGFPDDLVRDRLAELSADRSFSIKWRRKFQTALEGAEDDLAAEDDHW
ncbi:MAG: hypothetical protein IMZ75_16465 [Actinobacteria bacterium]|nr:hypothetical protein [Actinomycetota bacterium]